MVHIETLYEKLMRGKLGEEFTFDDVGAHFDKLLSAVDANAGNGLDLEFRYLTIASLLAQQPAYKCNSKPNAALNRYENVTAPDHSLVPLLRDTSQVSRARDAHEYINASYVDSLLPNRTGKRRYICTQGPLQSTIADFWLMVWRENVTVVVMLTRAIEKETRKCETYWPDAGAGLIVPETLYGVINVRLVDAGGDENVVERRFLVTNTDEKRTREIVQFQYTEWPDWGR
jgi:protein tyrosine phosphatase